MKRAYVICLLAISALALAGRQADLLPRQTEDIVWKTMPVMRADAAFLKAAQGQAQEMTAKMDEHTQLLEDIKAGKIDPLAWLQSKSKYFIVPPSAVYKPKLSGWVSCSYFLDPVALFSFGIDAPEKLRKATRSGEELKSLWLSGQDVYKLPGGQKLKAVVDETTQFYAANKFSASQTQRFYSFITESPDNSIVVVLDFINQFAALDVGESLADGPTLWLYLSSGGIFPGDISKPRDKNAQAPEDLDAALARAGMSYGTYQLYLGALSLAKSDAADPSTLEITADISSLSAEQAKAIKEMQDFYAIRKHNLKIYQKFAAQVDPLLALLGK